MRVKKQEIKKAWINLKLVGVILLSLLISIILLSPKMNSDTSKDSSAVEIKNTEIKGTDKGTKEKEKEIKKVDNVKYKIIEFYNLNIVIPHEWEEVDRSPENLFFEKKIKDSETKKISIHKYNKEVITIEDNKELISTLGKAYIEIINTDYPDSNIVSKMDLIGDNKDILYIKHEIEQTDENNNKYKEIRETYFIEKDNEIYSFMSYYKKGIDEQIDGTKDEEIYNIIRMFY